MGLANDRIILLEHDNRLVVLNHYEVSPPILIKRSGTAMRDLSIQTAVSVVVCKVRKKKPLISEGNFESFESCCKSDNG